MTNLGPENFIREFAGTGKNRKQTWGSGYIKRKSKTSKILAKNAKGF